MGFWEYFCFLCLAETGNIMLIFQIIFIKGANNSWGHCVISVSEVKNNSLIRAQDPFHYSGFHLPSYRNAHANTCSALLALCACTQICAAWMQMCFCRVVVLFTFCATSYRITRPRWKQIFFPPYGNPNVPGNLQLIIVQYFCRGKETG